MTFNEQNSIEQYVISKLTGHKFVTGADSAQPGAAVKAENLME